MTGKYSKQMLINEEAKTVLKTAKELLAADYKLKVTFSDVIIDIIGRYTRFARLPKDLKDYINAFTYQISMYGDVVGVLLFGSVAKGTYNRNSDVDLLVIVEKDKLKYYDITNTIKMHIESLRQPFLERGYHFRISVSILEKEDINRFKPIYIEFSSDGIILYERNHFLTEFIEKIKQIDYKRTFTQMGEVLTWKTK